MKTVMLTDVNRNELTEWERESYMNLILGLTDTEFDFVKQIVKIRELTNKKEVH